MALVESCTNIEFTMEMVSPKKIVCWRMQFRVVVDGVDDFCGVFEYLSQLCCILVTAVQF